MQNFKRGGLPWVRYGSSNKVNNCFTLMHTLVLLEAKSPSCRSCYRGTLCLAGGECEDDCRRIAEYSRKVWHAWRLCLLAVAVVVVVICIKRNRLAFMCVEAAPGPAARRGAALTHTGNFCRHTRRWGTAEKGGWQKLFFLLFWSTFRPLHNSTCRLWSIVFL